MREVVKFTPNVPVLAALQYATGRPVTGQYGDQMMFSLTDNRVMYLDPEPAAMLATLNLQVGEEFYITQKWSGRKSERRTWDVYPRVNRYSDKLDAQLQQSLVQAAGRKAAASSSQAVPADAPARGTGTYGPSPVPAPSPIQQMQASNSKPVPVKRQYADAFALFLVDAVHATTAAEKAVAAEGMPVKFDATAVQAIATTMFIQAGRDGFIEWNGGGR